MNRYRITLETVLDVDAESEEEAYEKIPEVIETCDMYILDAEEIEEK